MRTRNRDQYMHRLVRGALLIWTGYEKGCSWSTRARPIASCPWQYLESTGLAPKGQRVYELADGNEIRMDVTVAQVRFMGEFVGATVLFGDLDAEQLLGVIALELVGIKVDSRNQTLKRLPAVRLKKAARKGAPPQRT